MVTSPLNKPTGRVKKALTGGVGTCWVAWAVMLVFWWGTGGRLLAEAPASGGADLWSLKAPQNPPIPESRGSGHPIDRFIDATLAGHGLRRAPEAERRTLVRRLAWDLTGLPPTLDEVAAFLADETPDAFERLVDRFLASPAYGERWARWWLDLARYADTNGQDENKVMANAWRYRDWVIGAFNANQPYDRFIHEQLAGDLLNREGVPESEVFRRWTATGFLVLGPKMLAEQDKPKLVMDMVDEQIDVVGRAFLGLTLQCARCHDHKFDPVSARDYYALAGIFRSTKTMENLAFVSKFNERAIASAERRTAIEAHKAAVARLQKEQDALVRDANAALLERLKAEKRSQSAGAAASKDEAVALPKDPKPLYPESVRQALARIEAERDALKRSDPGAPEMALSVDEGTVADLPIHIRGSHLQLAADPVPRGFPEAIRVARSPAIPAKQSGRLELARWLTQPDHPLTARVLVNRVWQAHFGHGLVRSPDNFGRRGERPTHPELLDWLSRDFMDHGWDLKRLHRQILTSATWRQGGRILGDPRGVDSDPENRWLWHFPRQRLEAEMIRDGVMAVAGRLDRSMGGTLVSWKNDEYTPQDDVSEASRRRTLYLPVVRDRVYDLLTLFDFANPSTGVSRRTPTVVSHQALFWMNSPWVRDLSQALATSLGSGSSGVFPSVADRVVMAYERVLGRPPNPAEAARAVAFLTGEGVTAAAPDSPGRWAGWCQVLLASSEFQYRE